MESSVGIEYTKTKMSGNRLKIREKIFIFRPLR